MPQTPRPKLPVTYKTRDELDAIRNNDRALIIQLAADEANVEAIEENGAALHYTGDDPTILAAIVTVQERSAALTEGHQRLNALIAREAADADIYIQEMDEPGYVPPVQP